MCKQVNGYSTRLKGKNFFVWTVKPIQVFLKWKRKMICSGFIAILLNNHHSVKSVQLWSIFWSVFSCIQSEHRKIRTRKNCVSWHFSRSALFRTCSYYLPTWLYRINRFYIAYKYSFIISRRNKGVYGTQTNICDGAFLWKWLKAFSR